MPQSRRRFLKYVGAGAIAAAAAGGVGYYLYGKQQTYPTTPTQTVTIPKGWETASTYLKNNPPVATFKRRPYCLNPTDQQTIQFTNTSTDPDGDQLSTTWIIDHVEVSRERDYSAKLTEGKHWVTMRVSDGKEEASAGDQVTVDPDETSMYPVKPLHLRHKGVRYFVGAITPEWVLPSPTKEEMDEQLDTVRDDLGCNAITVVGGAPSEERMIECARLAMDKGFEKIFVQPSYVNATVDETIDKVGEFAVKVRSLTEVSDAVVYMVGHEFQLETAIIRGGYFERFANSYEGIDLTKVAAVYPGMFKRIIDVCKRNYGYPISYAGTPWESYEDLVPWADPAFESIGIDAYIHDFLGWDENWMIHLLNRLKRFRKPIHCADFGMMSYVGADKFGGGSPLYVDENPYDEEPQVRYTVRTLDMLNRARIDGCFWVQYNDLFDRGQGLYNPQTRKRKKAFYMYKSYQRAS